MHNPEVTRLGWAAEHLEPQSDIPDSDSEITERLLAWRAIAISRQPRAVFDPTFPGHPVPPRSDPPLEVQVAMEDMRRNAAARKWRALHAERAKTEPGLRGGSASVSSYRHRLRMA